MFDNGCFAISCISSFISSSSISQHTSANISILSYIIEFIVSGFALKYSIIPLNFCFVLDMKNSFSSSVNNSKVGSFFNNICAIQKNIPLSHPSYIVNNVCLNVKYFSLNIG